MQSQQPAKPESPIAKVDLYSERFSADCMHAKAILDHKGVSYSEFVIDNDPERREEMLQRAGAHSKVPQIFINGRAIGGWQQLKGLDDAGELDVLLAQKPRNIIEEEASRASRSSAQAKSAEGKPSKGLFSRFLRP